MAKASQFTTVGTLSPSEDYIPLLKKNGGVFENAKLTALSAGIGAPDSVARANALAAHNAAVAAQDVADTAQDAAWYGTGAARAANDVATSALAAAWAGTSAANSAQSVANTALVTAWDGTSAGVAAYNVATTALATAWAGTATADYAEQQAFVAQSQAAAAAAVATAALPTAWAGTSAAVAAYSVGQSAYTLSAAGTSAAVAAYAIGKAALETAWVGTFAPALDDLTDVVLTGPTATQHLVFDGANWVNTASVSTAATAALTFYYNDSASEVPGYSTLLTSPAIIGEDTDTSSIGGANRAAFIEAYVSGTLNRTLLDSGVWDFMHYVNVDDATRPGFLAFDVYTRNSTGTEIFWFSGTSGTISSTDPVVDTFETTQGSREISYDHRLVVKLFALRDEATTVNFSFHHNGTERNSHFHTPFGVAHNDLPGLQGGFTGEFYHLTQDQADAAVGSSGLPSAANRFVTQDDPSLDGIPENYALARAALETAWVGTLAASFAAATASSAYTLASAGTVGHSGTPILNGTAVLDLDGQVYQTVEIAADTTITVKNQKAHTDNRVQEITARLVGGSIARNIVCDNFTWMTDVVTTIDANQIIYVGLSSFGTAVNQITASALIEDTRFLSIDANSRAAIGLAITALDTAWFGTSSAHEALHVAQAALETAWAGTAAANSAYALAASGTISHTTLSADAGTVVFNMAGSAYQSCVIGGDTAIAVTNIQAPTQTHIQAITARIHNNNSGSTFNLFWDEFGVVGVTPPSSVTNNHSVFASFTSYGTSVQNVFIASSLHI